MMIKLGDQPRRRRAASLAAFGDAVMAVSMLETTSQLFLFPFPINGRAASRASSPTSLKASASCRKRSTTSSKREKLARTNLPLMGSIIFTTPLLPRLSDPASPQYSAKDSTHDCPGSYRSTDFWQSNSCVQKWRNLVRKSARGASKLNWLCSAKQMSMMKMLQELMPPLYPSFSPALSRRCFTTSMASTSRGLSLNTFCMQDDDTSPLLLAPAVLSVMSNLMRKGVLSCCSWLQCLNCDSGLVAQTKGSTISFITGIFAVRMASQ